jgi:transposase
METAPSAWLGKRWLVIYTALLDPRTSGEIAKQIGVSRPFIKKIVALYKRFGPSGIETAGSGGRRNAYLSPDAETTFLAPFREQAARGEIVTTNVIHTAFEAAVGRSVDASTIYRLLERHQWRKIVPRAIHPHADPIEQHHFKKTSVRWLT